jgi:hypothetical protein
MGEVAQKSPNFRDGVEMVKKNRCEAEPEDGGHWELRQEGTWVPKCDSAHLTPDPSPAIKESYCLSPMSPVRVETRNQLELTNLQERPTQWSFLLLHKHSASHPTNQSQDLDSFAEWALPTRVCVGSELSQT